MNKSGKNICLLLACLFFAGYAVLNVSAWSRAVHLSTRAATTPPLVRQKRKKPRRPPATPRKPCGEMTEHIDTNLSGEYDGTLSYPDGGIADVTKATLRVSGVAPSERVFTLTAGGQTWEGSFPARTTCGYTGVSMRFRGSQDDRTLSLRACNTKGGLSLSNIEGQPSFSFEGKGASPEAPAKWGKHKCP